MDDVHAIINEVDKLPLKCSNPTPEEIIPPTPICIKPSNADAVPAFFVNGESAIAAAFGYVSPEHINRKKRKIMIAYNPYHALITPAKKNILNTTWKISVVLKISSFENLRVNRWFNWLPPIKPTDNNAKIPPYNFALM